MFLRFCLNSQALPISLHQTIHIGDPTKLAPFLYKNSSKMYKSKLQELCQRRSWELRATFKDGQTTCHASLQPSKCMVNSSPLRSLASHLRMLKTPSPALLLNTSLLIPSVYPLHLSPYPSSLLYPLGSHSFMVDVYLYFLARF